MKYKLNLSPKLDLSAPSITEAQIGATPQPPQFYTWQPSTWPTTPTTVDEEFVLNLKRIFEESILSEIANVVSDAPSAMGTYSTAVGLQANTLSRYEQLRKSAKP